MVMAMPSAVMAIRDFANVWLGAVRIGIRRHAAGPNGVSIHGKGGTAPGGPLGRAFLPASLPYLLRCVTHKEPPSKNRQSHKEKKKDTNHVSCKKAALVGLSAPHDGAQAKKSRFRGPGQRARAAAGTAFRAERTMASAASSGPSDGELPKQPPAQKGSGLGSILWMWVSVTSTVPKAKFA